MNWTIRTGDSSRSRLRSVIGACLGLAVTATYLTWGAPSTASAGVTYYVDQKHPSTSDLNPGTQDRPFTTIQKAANVVRAGDIVLVRPGVYPERVMLGPAFTGGTTNEPITFRADPRRTVTMYGFGANVHAKPVYLRIEGFQITQAPTPNGGGIQLELPVTQGVAVVDNYLYDIRASAVSLVGVGDFTVAGNEVFQSVKGIAIVGTGYVVEDNRVTRLKQWGMNLDVDYMRYFGANGVIRRNYFADTILTPEWVGKAHVDCFQTFTIHGAVRDILIESNVCGDAAQGVFAERQNYPNENLTIRNNIFMRIGAWGVAGGAKGTATDGVLNLRVYNNAFVDHGLYGVGCGTYSTCEVYNNIFYNVKTPYMNNRATSLVTGNNLLNKDPRFVDPARGDFHLQPGSPAIDAGKALEGFNTDREGTIRPQGSAWDIGPYEYRKQPLASQGLLPAPGR